ncbi:MAG: hypothetical protein NPIRA05_18180 [Nitrospirales bacterium]|nr:MAG: hypothetical protein NPIRA05_18180 [Nitrospirales bacterium]
MTPKIETSLSSTMAEGTSLLAQLPDASFPVILMTVLVLIALALWLIWGRQPPHSHTSANSLDQSFDQIDASTRPLFLNTEASIFNLVRLAVQDSYLVLAKLPLSSVLAIEKDNREKRRTILKTIQHIKLDLALIHPGTLRLEKVIRITSTKSPATSSQSKAQLAAAILQSAGIDTVTLDPNTSYTVPQVLTLLGLGDED